MKKIIATSLLISATILNLASASDIVIAKNIKSHLREKIEKDLNKLENFKFSQNVSQESLNVLGLSSLNSSTATGWLNQRVSYVISENALSIFNLLVKRVIYVDQKDVDYPNADIIPYSLDQAEIKNPFNEEKSFTVMSNIGSALYSSGKSEKQVYGMKISRGFLHKSLRVPVTSPRAGIIQIGEGLFAPELTVNRENSEAMANTIFRLATFFHEARHSDGNGKSLGFMHTSCPKGHDYEGQPACDENLNGPYTVGALITAEMLKSCDESSCDVKDREALKMLILDSANRILTTTHKGEKSTKWDPTPESL